MANNGIGYQGSRERFLSKVWRVLVIRPVLRWQELRCLMARNYLLTHDRNYRSHYVSLELVHRRNSLYDSGVLPDSPKIPFRSDVEDELPPMKWPHGKDSGLL